MNEAIVSFSWAWRICVNKASRDIAVSLAQSRMETVCGDVLQNRQISEKFESYDNDDKVLMLDLVTKYVSVNHASYEITLKDLPGRMVCDVGINEGRIKWEHGTKSDPRVLFVAGTLNNTNGSTVLKAADGVKYHIPPDAITFTPMSSNTHVVASIDPTSSLVKSVRFVSDGTKSQLTIPPSSKSQ
jgi:hypothetical protein